MVYSYTPKYYSTLHDSITSLCKTILPFSFKKRCLPAADHEMAKLQSDNLKWQQDSFHQMLNLMGLHKEGILAESEVSAFRTHLLETLIASPPEKEQPVILRDKLLFLQELLYAKCITEEEYHSTKRPLLQRLAVQGAEIETGDVIVAGMKDLKVNSEDEWSVIDLKDDKCLLTKDNSNSKNITKHGSAMKQIKGASSVFSFVSSYKPGKNKVEKSIFDSPSVHMQLTEPKFSCPASDENELGFFRENPFWDSHLKEKQSETRTILMTESLPPPESIKESGGPDKADKLKRKPFRTLFQREQRDRLHGGSVNRSPESEEIAGKSAKKQWGFDRCRKWKKNNSEDDETAPLPLNDRSDSEAYLGSTQLVSKAIGEGPDTKLIKRKLHSDGSPSDFFIDKVLGEKIKKELSRIQTELNTTNPNLKFSDDQIEAISTNLPVDKADLKNYFPKSWCDRYGDVVLDVVKKEFKDHVGEMENMRNNTREKRSNSMRWTIFEEDDENFHPNLFSQRDNSFFRNGGNPFFS
ncbi:Uveal autoantigen with coiled-coil domains and ankyrin repeats isoform 1 [Quillaja saponaria]|uniref:Uveal autoantigen with coiled-coil domains and ankyrin repeats isoform 1 n=1 Tax=Quillaja saponaria TaxID=32244 RepID=A0AAD7LIJ1_QUISA|nr:Uveal autoantigen with coiled-coil domains and ankyrin repeats isoform 1 [Quillaja saponaria]